MCLFLAVLFCYLYMNDNNRFILQIAGHYCLIEKFSDNIFERLPNLLPFKITDVCNVNDFLFKASFGHVDNVATDKFAEFIIDDIRKITLYRRDNESSSFDIRILFRESLNSYYMRVTDSWRNIVIDIDSESDEAYFALNEMLMIAFIYSSAFYKTVLVHSSCIKLGDVAIAFLGHSGAGKSTHSRLWLKYIENSELLNDDQPAVRICDDGKVYIYGTPWSGKTECYKNRYGLLKSMVFLKQDTENVIEHISPLLAFQYLLSSCSMIREEDVTFNLITETISNIASNVPVYVLRNRPEREAVLLSYKTSLD